MGATSGALAPGSFSACSYLQPDEASTGRGVVCVWCVCVCVRARACVCWYMGCDSGVCLVTFSACSCLKSEGKWESGIAPCTAFNALYPPLPPPSPIQEQHTPMNAWPHNERYLNCTSMHSMLISSPPTHTHKPGLGLHGHGAADVAGIHSGTAQSQGDGQAACRAGPGGGGEGWMDRRMALGHPILHVCYAAT